MSERSETEDDLPSYDEVINGLRQEASDKASTVSASERRYLESVRDRSVESQVKYAHLKGIRDHYWHKGRWSWFLMGAVAAMLIFQSVLLWKVGKGDLDFTAYQWLLPALLVQNLGQVVGLAVYAVRFLFSDIRDQ